MFDNVDDAVDYIYKSYLKAEKHLPYNQLDKYKRTPKFTADILEKLNLKWNSSNILVTGSKGKGSVAVILSDLLQINYSKVGLFTSPHLEKFNERININKEVISDDDIIKYLNNLVEYIDEIDSKQAIEKYISPVGILLLIALQFYHENHVVVNVFECGKGVLYDDVNQINRDYSIINPIFLEHTRELGNSIEEIAENKSEVIKEGQKAVYSAKQDSKVEKIIKEKAIRENVNLYMYGIDFYAENMKLTIKGTIFDVKTKKNYYRGLEIPLLGHHQAENAALAIQVYEDIVEDCDFNSIRRKMSSITWPGRLEVICEKPMIILDACINRESAVLVKNILKKIDSNNIRTIVGIPMDKDYQGVVNEMLEVSKKVIMTESYNRHYKFSKKQLDLFSNTNGKVEYIADLSKAIEKVKQESEDDSIICILGTTALISDVKKL